MSRQWTVAHHCLLVSAMCSEPNKLAALLHDSEEWIFHDIGRPVKGHPLMADYRAAAERFRMAILRSFGLPGFLPGEVKHFDDVVVNAEADVLHHGTADWPVRYDCGSNDELEFAKSMIPQMIDLHPYTFFLKQFTVLTGGDVLA